MGDSVHARAMRRAADLVGGKSALREKLRVPMRDLERWMDGGEKPPMDVFLKAVDIVSATPMGTSTVVARPITFLEAKFERRDARVIMEAALDAAITATSADKGNVQISSAEGLRIVAQRGFQRPFLDFFTVVERGSCCAAARQAGMRLVIPDVSSHPLFRGTAAGAVLLEAGVHAVQSTPVMGSGGVIGMISTHYAVPRQLTETEGDALDQVARRAAFWLEGGAL